MTGPVFHLRRTVDELLSSEHRLAAENEQLRAALEKLIKKVGNVVEHELEEHYDVAGDGDVPNLAMSVGQTLRLHVADAKAVLRKFPEPPCERHDFDKHERCLICGYDKRADP